MDDIVEITLLVADILERLEIRYVIGGSLASSLHGHPRATQDVDIVADLRNRHLPSFLDSLHGLFYFDKAAIRQSVRERTSFNIIHLETMFKVDVFVSKNDVVAEQELNRGERFAVTELDGRELVVASAEDTVAQKLYWYGLGDQVSDRQWTDVIGILKVSGARLDREYLRQAAALLEVNELLDRALRECGME